MAPSKFTWMAAAFLSACTDFTAPPQQSSVVVDCLERCRAAELTRGTLTGRVTDIDGRGVRGVFVDVAHSDSRVQTGEDGSYTIPGTKPGRQVVRVLAVPLGCLLPEPQTAVVTPNGVATVNFVLVCPPPNTPPTN